jgi:hypothetical protein
MDTLCKILRANSGSDRYISLHYNSHSDCTFLPPPRPAIYIIYGILYNLLSPLSLCALLPAHRLETQKRSLSGCVSTAVVCWDKGKRVEVVPRGTIPGFFNSSR